ncbi:MFS transporter, partial [Salmonella enterica]
CGLAIIAALTMGFFYKLNEQRFAFIIEEIAQRKKTGNQIVATNNKQSISTVNN